LRNKKKLDHYMLFAIGVSANAESEITGTSPNPLECRPRRYILCGVEQLELWLRKFPGVATLAILTS